MKETKYLIAAVILSILGLCVAPARAADIRYGHDIHRVPIHDRGYRDFGPGRGNELWEGLGEYLILNQILRSTYPYYANPYYPPYSYPYYPYSSSYYYPPVQDADNNPATPL